MIHPDNTQDLIDTEIVAPLPTKLNRLKKTNIEAFYYWSEVQKLIQQLGESSDKQ